MAAIIVGGTIRRQRRNKEVKGGSAGQGTQPGEGFGQRQRVEANLTANVAAVGKAGGGLTVPVGAGETGCHVI